MNYKCRPLDETEDVGSRALGALGTQTVLVNNLTVNNFQSAPEPTRPDSYGLTFVLLLIVSMAMPWLGAIWGVYSLTVPGRRVAAVLMLLWCALVYEVLHQKGL